jgi:hypothetical protein
VSPVPRFAAPMQELEENPDTMQLDRHEWRMAVQSLD